MGTSWIVVWRVGKGWTMTSFMIDEEELLVVFDIRECSEVYLGNITLHVMRIWENGDALLYRCVRWRLPQWLLLSLMNPCRAFCIEKDHMIVI
jgi:hypothetical protein